MPDWTDENGRSWFGKLECKRCLQIFEAIGGEVPEHDCLGDRWTSESRGDDHHVPVAVRKG